MTAESVDVASLEAEALDLVEELWREHFVLAQLTWVRDHEDDPLTEHLRAFALDRLPFGVAQIDELAELVTAGTELFVEYREALRELDPSFPSRAAAFALERFQALESECLPAT